MRIPYCVDLLKPLPTGKVDTPRVIRIPRYSYFPIGYPGFLGLSPYHAGITRQLGTLADLGYLHYIPGRAEAKRTTIVCIGQLPCCHSEAALDAKIAELRELQEALKQMLYILDEVYT